ncbi:MAG: hypothetical protein IKV85_00305 [Ruminococcus sp.]|nr:hypothetical protein [Ruminococcus sp.]
MEKGILLNFFKQKNISNVLVNKEESEKIIRKLISIANGDKLHYLWSNYKSDSFITQQKISCNLDSYIKTLSNIIVFDNMYFVVDKACLSDLDNDLVFELSKAEIVELMREFYWELDEIYIVDIDCSVFISLNHNFELSLYGDKSLDLCDRILKKLL